VSVRTLPRLSLLGFNFRKGWSAISFFSIVKSHFFVHIFKHEWRSRVGACGTFMSCLVIQFCTGWHIGMDDAAGGVNALVMYIYKSVCQHLSLRF
jgi:hypothetical protein